MPRPRPHSAPALGRASATQFCVVVALCACDMLGGFNRLDGVIYDTLHVCVRAFRPVPLRTALCYANPETLSDPASVCQLLAELEDAGPRGIAIVATKSQLANGGEGIEFRAPAKGRTWLIPSVSVSIDREYLSPPSEPLAMLGETPDGVQRWQWTKVRVDDSERHTLEGVIANLEGTPPNLVPSQYRIAYRGPAGSLPYFTARHVLDGKFIPELIRGKVVLVGPRSERTDHRVHVSSDAAGMDLLEFHGQAVNTLLARRPICDASPAARVLFAMVMTVAMSWMYRNCRLGPGITVMFLGAGAVVSASGCALAFVGTWISPVVPLIVSVTSLLITWQKHVTRLQNRTEALCAAVIADRRGLQSDTAFPSSEDPWEHICALFEHWLPGGRIAILGRSLRSSETDTLRCVGCDQNDLHPMHSDAWLQRAIERCAPVELRDAPFLTEVSGETQFLTAVAFRGEVFGFIVASIPDAHPTLPDSSVDVLQRLADEAAEMLQRHEALHVAPPPRRGKRKGQRSAGWEGMISGAELAAKQLRGNLARYERLVGLAPHPVMLLDSRGRMSLANAEMQRFADAHSAPFRMLPMRWVAEVTGIEVRALRDRLWQMTLNHKGFSCRGRTSRTGQDVILYFTPLVADELLAEDGIHPFSVASTRLDIIPASSPATERCGHMPVTASLGQPGGDGALIHGTAEPDQHGHAEAAP